MRCILAHPNSQSRNVDKKVVRHKGYDLHCSARAVDGGKFVPVLVVAKVAWPSHSKVIALAPGTFSNEEAATDAAHAQGIEWVTHYGHVGAAA